MLVGSIADAMVVLLPWSQLWLKTRHSVTVAYIFKIQDTWLSDQTDYISLLIHYDENECCCLFVIVVECCDHVFSTVCAEKA